MKRQIVNIINFIRGCEPRLDMDLLTPVVEQVKLVNKYNLASTFLLQYDALIVPEFVNALKDANNKTEYGVWLEIVQPLAEAAGVDWHGRYSWDWYANAGFSVAYTRSERERLIDALFDKFKEVYGYYPKVMGSWAIDAYTLEYTSKKYGLDASCTCKEQWGTDGYTFWGGFFNQGYYPSVNNMLCPAQTKQNQIDIPTFRMLGSDAIYQYDTGLDVNGKAAEWQHVVTLEPVYCGGDGGGNPEWVDWYLKENFSGKCLSYAYTQAGQENSFGWGSMGKGLTYQIDKISELVTENKIEALTLGETGRWFKSEYEYTPACVSSAFTDRHEKGRTSVWYDCKNYRINLYTEEGRFHIRDIYLFREKYEERYLNSVNTVPSMLFDNLPLVDGNRFSGNGVRAGLYPEADGHALTYKDIIYKEENDSITVVYTDTEVGNLSVKLTPESIKLTADKDFTLVHKTNPTAQQPKREADGKIMKLVHNGFEYEVKLEAGKFAGTSTVESVNAEIVILTDR